MEQVKKVTNIATGLGNYYGEVEFKKVELQNKEAKYFMTLEDWAGYYGVPITQKMYEEVSKVDWDEVEIIDYNYE